MNIKILISVMLSFVVSGCVYPVYRTIQPETKVEVVDIKGVALSGAKVYLSTKEFYPYKFKFEIVQSDEKGIAEFDSIKKWGTDMLMIHGVKPENDWALCVEKENFKTQVIHPTNKEDFAHQKVILYDGEATNCLGKNAMKHRNDIP